MADISFYKYLEAAFRHKLFKDTKASSFNYLGYNLPYETAGAKKGIFEYARRVLPSFYSMHFADTEEGHLQMARDFLQKLDRRQDPELPKYFDPAQAPAEYEQVIDEAKGQSQAESPPVPAEQAGVTGMPGLPSGQSISAARPARVVYQTPPTEVERPPSKIFIANKGGVITGEHAIKPSARFSFPSAFSNFGKNIASKTGVFIKRNLTPMRLGTLVSGGIGAVAGSAFGPMGTLTGGIGGALMPSWLRSGGGGRFLGKVGSGAINAGVGISNQASRLSVGGIGKKWVIGLLAGFLLLTVGVGFIAVPSGQPGSTQTPPVVYPPYQPEPASGIVGCPLNKAEIIAGSKDQDGHCSPSYQVDNPCDVPDTTGRATAMDLKSSDRTVYLPYLGGSSAEWTIEQIDTNTDYTDKGQRVNGGYAVVAKIDDFQGKSYRIRFVHLETPNVIQGQKAQSNTPIGQYRTKENHVHVTIQENNVFQNTDTYFNLCQ